MDVFDDFGFAAPPQAPHAVDPRAAAPAAPAPAPAVYVPPAMSLARPAGAAGVGSRTKAGLGVLAVAAGAATGGVLGGPMGALMGLVGVGAARNLARAQGIASSDPAEQGEAVRNLALAVVGLGGAGYLAYRIFFKDKDD